MNMNSVATMVTKAKVIIHTLQYDKVLEMGVLRYNSSKKTHHKGKFALTLEHIVSTVMHGLYVLTVRSISWLSWQFQL